MADSGLLSVQGVPPQASFNQSRCSQPSALPMRLPGGRPERLKRRDNGVLGDNSPVWRTANPDVQGDPMSDLTKLESKFGEVLGLAMAAQGATRKVKGMLDDEQQDLGALLERMHQEASETEERCMALAGELDGKKTAILEQARETKQSATEMMETYLEGEDDALDGFEFLTMAEAGEVGHWSIVETFSRQAGVEKVTELVEWALPIQQAHLRQALECSVELAGREDPNEVKS
jgi:hypothetical protein